MGPDLSGDGCACRLHRREVLLVLLALRPDAREEAPLIGSCRRERILADDERVAGRPLLLRLPREDRRRLLEAGLIGGELFELRLSVENRPGTVAEIALALGRAGVNIEDMALYPAPDMRTGAISLWVAGDAEARRAAEIVRGLGHAVSIST